MDLDDIILSAILAAYDSGGMEAAFTVADDCDIPDSDVTKIISDYR